jgi:SAM-dependent methyltransferase
MKISAEQSRVLDTYRRVYGLGPEVTYEQVEIHERLERDLTRALLESTPATRWQVFEDAYSTLYNSLPWLNQRVEGAEAADPKIGHWQFLVRGGARVYEIGSGKAQLLRFLLKQGCTCVATEITRERGARHMEKADGLEWHVSDGVNLSRFEPAASYDYVISTQVVEHIHPDDVVTHFSEARQLLKPGGQYIFNTPHPSCGPHDLSQVFGLERAKYMHLHEYTWVEMVSLLRKAGYSRIDAVFGVPGLSHQALVGKSRLYLLYLSFWDRIEESLGMSMNSRRRLRKYLRMALVPSNVWICATK